MKAKTLLCQLWTAMALLTQVAVAVAAEPGVTLTPGLYEISVSLELPHVESAGASKQTTQCLSAADTSSAYGLAVLSENNPLARCAKRDVRQEGGTVSFEVACEGVNAAFGKATFQVMGEAFSGRIEMKMGGKNMTMTETQRGKRIGACQPGPPG